ncbi:MAG: hypothetical protein H0X40_00505 [Chthoniobacterales bacterium]|nr:hypothetical protein [Chthoniobacterales bacterium]
MPRSNAAAVALRASRCLLTVILLSSPGISQTMAAASVVKVQKKSDGGYELIRNGQPFFINGAGGSSHLDLLKELGGNSLRTWGIEQLDEVKEGKTLLQKANDLGLAVAAGIWIGHGRHGFDYSNEAQIKKQRDAVRAAVLKYKDDPAILVWGLGNEMEGPASDGKDVRIWKELDYLCTMVHQLDPNHPVMTVIAGATDPKVRAIAANYPSLDILGVNAYASATGVGKALKSAGWTKPFVLTEFGPSGAWEVQKTSWGAPIEPAGQQKAGAYFSTARTVIDDGRGTCLGTYAFLWGNKQETTSTWYGMFLPTGEKLPPVDAMSFIWTGKFPANRCPKLKRFISAADSKTIAPESTNTAKAEVADAAGNPLTYDWSVVSESTDRKVGGDTEAAPPSHPECVVEGKGPELTFRAPATAGAYRVFLVVRDGKGGATSANFPFRVQ